MREKKSARSYGDSRQVLLCRLGEFGILHLSDYERSGEQFTFPGLNSGI